MCNESSVLWRKSGRDAVLSLRKLASIITGERSASQEGNLAHILSQPSSHCCSKYVVNRNAIGSLKNVLEPLNMHNKRPMSRDALPLGVYRIVM